MAAEFTLATFNVWCDGEGPHAFEARRRLIAETIASVRPDIVCLQEAPDAEFVRDLTDYLMRVQKRVLRAACTRFVGADGWVEYLAVIHTGTNRVATRVEGPGGERFAIAIDLLQPRLRLFTVHLDALSAQYRLAEADRVATLLQDGGPVVVAGDFNEQRDGAAVQALCPPLEHLAPDPAEVRSTFPTEARGEAARNGNVRDHILARGVAVVESGVAGAGPSNGIWPSDHLMVWARLSVE
jgi:endonuclease/exonuclease/phosphatase family metal-dependent hydrolase